MATGACPTCRDVHQGEEPHPGVPVHRPLLGLAVGLAAVVHEARVVPLGPGVDDAVLRRTDRGRDLNSLKFTNENPGQVLSHSRSVILRRRETLLPANKMVSQCYRNVLSML